MNNKQFYHGKIRDIELAAEESELQNSRSEPGYYFSERNRWMIT